MQQQSGFEEEETPPYQSQGYDMGLEEVRIEGVAQAGIKYMRRWMLALACAAVTGLILFTTLMTGYVRPSLLLSSVFVVGIFALMLYAETSLLAKFWPKKHRPTLVLSPEGIALESPLSGFPLLPWSEIGEIRGVSFLGFPLALLTDPHGKIKQRLGSKYWMYWWPGGIGLNALTFGQTGKALAERISRYRDDAT